MQTTLKIVNTGESWKISSKKGYNNKDRFITPWITESGVIIRGDDNRDITHKFDIIKNKI